MGGGGGGFPLLFIDQWVLWSLIFNLVNKVIMNNFWNNHLFLVRSRLGYGAQRHFQQYFSYIMAFNFIGVPGEKPPTCCKSLTNFINIMLYRVHLAWVGFELTTLVVIGTDCIVSYKSNYHTFTTKMAESYKFCKFISIFL